MTGDHLLYLGLALGLLERDRLCFATNGSKPPRRRPTSEFETDEPTMVQCRVTGRSVDECGCEGCQMRRKDRDNG